MKDDMKLLGLQPERAVLGMWGNTSYMKGKPQLSMEHMVPDSVIPLIHH